jgi:hypothetical protein
MKIMVLPPPPRVAVTVNMERSSVKRTEAETAAIKAAVATLNAAKYTYVSYLPRTYPPPH